MLIRVPCILGEQFEHHKPWGTGSPLWLVGVDFFLWSCNIDPITLHGSKNRKNDYNTDYFETKDTEIKISFEVPDNYFRDAGVLLRELGIKSDKSGKIRSISLNGDKDWLYRVVIANGDRETLEIRTEEMDRLFAPLLPPASVDLLKYL